ncbi:hypothetical protein HHI36_007586 [Cryptolaemus montrouzieri]|uniref:Receptor ligand binding region domain-containing protein n=1 Tax=Cryptolaemus montrouzieri TaxID=559131 RepID=A0ABD2MQH2_9CUCU
MPQGSVVGLFLDYINCLLKCSSPNKVVLSAEDASVAVSSRHQKELVEGPGKIGSHDPKRNEEPVSELTSEALKDAPVLSLTLRSNITVSSFLNITEAITINQDISWPVKKEAVVEGDLILGGLMMVHEREDTITCGPIMPQGGIQALEAMLYTLDRINSGAVPMFPNITLGAHILDDCDKDTYGLEIAVDFIKGRCLEVYSSCCISSVTEEK